MKQKKPAVKGSKATKTPKDSAQKHQAAAKTPATGLKTSGQLPATKPLQPRSSAQAKKAASAMQKALAEGDAVVPSGREAPAGEHRTVSTTAACGLHKLVPPQWHSLHGCGRCPEETNLPDSCFPAQCRCQSSSEPAVYTYSGTSMGYPEAPHGPVSLSWAASERCAGAMELCSDAARFAIRAGRFPFLAPEQIRDANRRRPDHPAYNPRTLHIPADWFKKANVSEGQRQWYIPMHAPFCDAAMRVDSVCPTTGLVLHGAGAMRTREATFKGMRMALF